MKIREFSCTGELGIALLGDYDQNFQLWYIDKEGQSQGGTAQCKPT